MTHARVVEMIEAQNRIKRVGGESTLALDYGHRIDERKKRIRSHQQTIREIEGLANTPGSTAREADDATIRYCRRVIADLSGEIRNLKGCIKRLGYTFPKEERE